MFDKHLFLSIHFDFSALISDNISFSSQYHIISKTLKSIIVYYM